MIVWEERIAGIRLAIWYASSNELTMLIMRMCNLCGRPLLVDLDPLSGDCGGDCWGCIGKIEADHGWKPSVDFVQKEIQEGWREADGTAKPQVFFLTDGDWLQKVAAGYVPAFERSLSHCRVCGFDHYPDRPWGRDGKLASFDICVSCGVQFGYEDETKEGCHAVRKRWVEVDRCAFWASPSVQPPANWSPSKQLRLVPPAFVSPDNERLIALAAEHERSSSQLERRSRLP